MSVSLSVSFVLACILFVWFVLTFLLVSSSLSFLPRVSSFDLSSRLFYGDGALRNFSIAESVSSGENVCFVVFNYAPISIFLVQSCWINKCFVMNVQIFVRSAVIKSNVPIERAEHRSVMDWNIMDWIQARCLP